MQEPTIRRAGSADAARLADLGAATFTDTFAHLYPPEDLAHFLAETHAEGAHAEILADPRQAVWLAMAADRPVGYAHAGPCNLPHADVTPRCLELKRLYVLKPWQGAGLAARLMDEAMGWMTAREPPGVFLGVWSENHRAQRFYARYGFRAIGEYEFPVGASRDQEFIYKLHAAHRNST
ncbi:GNAT family N-acetyltransferase [Phenylobacterium sp.]|jgi:ribosomal protein S18 acetylase RimI-like enzyme|uniref:GNAT family N-acetyltransferase n=1 Tax=Phenylobacterium sp. TaxID=1871053 RepID=UPI002E31090D|nr:GNAT family N-acetyltransferase [Phenylobacterium sp.]HEX2562047.1 GNAT family N-acetyltransferase [Phenylobacterium sp.]